MLIVNLNDAKTHLSKLVEQAAQGESFIIAKAGKPMVKVVAIAAEDSPAASRLGFMQGEISVPDDFDHMCGDDIVQLFEINDI